MAVFTGLATAIGAAAASAGTWIAANITASTVGSFLLRAAVGTALNLVAAKIAGGGKPDAPKKIGNTSGPGAGGEVPRSFIMGLTATYGSLVWWNDHGDWKDNNNAYRTTVYAISDLPVQGLEGVIVNGIQCTINRQEDPDRIGYPIEEYRKKGKNYLWVKFYDGTQTQADSFLVDKASTRDRPWEDTRVGVGVAYAIVTALVNPDLHKDTPRVKFIVRGIRLYDISNDSSQGGSGSQRWGVEGTYGTGDLTAVQCYNILRGIRYRNDWFYGGQTIGAGRLPAGHWQRMIERCREPVERRGQRYDKYTSGLEVPLDMEPLDVLSELITGCGGRLADTGNSIKMHVGRWADADAIITDGDILGDAAQSFTPFFGIDDSVNGVIISYIDPDQLWEPMPLSVRWSPRQRRLDGDRHLTIEVQLSTVYNAIQADRVAKNSLAEAQRARRHTFMLPSDFWDLEPGIDRIDWNSERNGYIEKKFRVDGILDLANGDVLVDATEIDPTDYDYDPEFDYPDPRRGRTTKKSDQDGPLGLNFEVAPHVLPDNSGRPRKPAVRVTWNKDIAGVTGIRWKGRNAVNQQEIPSQGSADHPDPELLQRRFTVRGRQATVGGRRARHNTFNNFGRGYAIISEGLSSNVEYEFNFKPIPSEGKDWLPEWIRVVTPSVGIGREDLMPDLGHRIDEAWEQVQAQQERVDAAIEAANEALGAVGTINEEVRQDLHDIATRLEGINTGEVSEILGLALAGHIKGWVSDPTFHRWSVATPPILTQWSISGPAAWASRVIPDTPYLSSLMITAPTGNGSYAITQTSGVAAQIRGDIGAEYVVIDAWIRPIGGSLAGSYLRAKWRETASGPWVRGHAFGIQNAQGILDDHWGFEVDGDPMRVQSRSFVWQRPFPLAQAIQLELIAKVSTSGAAVQMQIIYLDVREATEAEIAGYTAGANARTQIDQLKVEINGPGGYLAALRTELQGEFGESLTSIRDDMTIFGNDQRSLAGRVNTLSASFGDANLFLNPDFELDDTPIPSGTGDSLISMPRGWVTWPNGMQVVRRSSSASAAAVQNAPSRFIGMFPGDGLRYRAMAFQNRPVSPGDNIQISLMFASAGASTLAAVNLIARAIWRDSEGNTGSITPTTRTVSVNSTAWASTTWADFVAPAGAAYFDLELDRSAGSSRIVYFTRNDARRVTRAAVASIQQIAQAAADGDGASTALINDINARFGSTSAFVTETSSAVARVDNLSSAYVLRQRAGQAAGSMEAVAVHNPGGPPLSVLRFSYNQIDLNGSVSARDLLIQDPANLIPDDQFLDPRNWTLGAEWSFLRPENNASMKGANSIQFAYAGGTGYSGRVVSLPFVVEGGEEYYFRAQVRIGGGTRLSVRFFLRPYDQDFTAGSIVLLGAERTITATEVVTVSATAELPVGARWATFEAQVNRSNTDASFKFSAPIVRKKDRGAALITPNSVTVAEVNTESLAAREGWIGRVAIGEAQIDVLRITGGSTGRSFSSERDDSLSIGTGGTGWVRLTSITIPSNMMPRRANGNDVSARILMNITTQYRTGGTPDEVRPIAFRLLRNNTEIWRRDEFSGVVNGAEHRTMVGNFTRDASNGDEFEWQIWNRGGPSFDLVQLSTLFTGVVLMNAS